MSQKQLAIHAGSHKTGSSAIQRYLYEHRDELEQQGVHYLHRGNANSSLWMLRAFKRDLAQLPAFSHLGLDEEGVLRLRTRARKRLARLAGASEAPLAVLSAEAIGAFAHEELQELYDVTSAHYPRIVIHQYFRPMKARMESAYQERLKHGFATLDQKFHLGYNRRVELLDGVFGRDNVNIYKYDGAVFPDGDVVKHFLGALDIAPPGGIATRAFNTGLSLPAVRLLYVYRKFNPDLMPGDRQIVKALARLQGDDFRFHSSLFDALLATGPNAVTLFERRAGFSITEDIQADDNIGIATEQALTDISPESLLWLQQQVNKNGQGEAALPTCSDLEAIAALVGRLAGDQPG